MGLPLTRMQALGSEVSMTTSVLPGEKREQEASEIERSIVALVLIKEFIGVVAYWGSPLLSIANIRYRA